MESKIHNHPNQTLYTNPRNIFLWPTLLILSIPPPWPKSGWAKNTNHLLTLKKNNQQNHCSYISLSRREVDIPKIVTYLTTVSQSPQLQDTGALF